MIKLYTFPISPNGRRVRVCAHEAGVPLELSNIDFAKAENRTPDYLALNPMGKAPTLVDGDFALWESAAEICYVAQVGGSPLWPADARGQADVLRWLFFCSCHVDPYFTTLMVERFIKARRGAPEDETASGRAIEWLVRFVQVIEHQLAEREFVTGRFGLADIALGCTLGLSSLVRYDLSPYPHIRAWLERLHARESWRACTAA
jgi:glutathione S-transferase